MELQSCLREWYHLVNLVYYNELCSRLVTGLLSTSSEDTIDGRPLTAPNQCTLTAHPVITQYPKPNLCKGLEQRNR